jgi:hypothetical protein
MSLIRINKNPSVRELAIFSAAWFVFLGLFGLACWNHGRHPAAQALWILACVVPLSGAAGPGVPRYAYLCLSYVTYPVGMVVSHVALAVVYFLVLTPIGLAMRLLRRDPLARRFDAAEKSYWKPADATRRVASYFKQG